MKKFKTLFFGSGDFAVPILEQLLNCEFIDICAVVTQPDKPAGRKQEMLSVPVKELLEKFYPSVPIYTPTLYRVEQAGIVGTERPELIIVADYGQILPEYTIQYPQYKCLNIHGSVLPDLRGAVPIPLSILNGYKKTGVSILVMTTGLDDGPVIASSERSIEDNDTTATLKRKLAEDGAGLLIETLPGWFSGEIDSIPQDESKVTFADKSLINKDRASFGTNTSVFQVDRMVRAFNPWPIAWCSVVLNNKTKRLKVFSVQVVENLNEMVKYTPGQIIREKNELLLILQDGVLKLKEIQLEGKPLGTGKDYLYLAGASVL